MNHPFRSRLASGRPIVADGAMGTQIYGRGIAYDECFDWQSIERPELIEAIHREYIQAGAEIIETNTFGANRFRLAAHGLDDRVGDINRKAARLARGAREICGESVFVAGSVGPTARTLLPYGNAEPSDVREAFEEQIAALLEGGVDLLVLETFSDLDEIELAIEAARSVADVPIIAEMTFGEDLCTPRGYTPQQVADRLTALGADVVGANCSVGPSMLLDVVEGLLAAGAPCVSAMPNAGFPNRVDGRIIYLSSPEYVADYGRRMVDLGAVIVGGCCGTTPSHTYALKRALSEGERRTAVIEVALPPEPEPLHEPAAEESSFRGKLGRQRVISVEIRPPRGANPAKAVAGACLLRDAGADAVNVVDSAMARVRMGAVATAVLVRQEAAIDSILHFTTRDRNLMAIQSDLIGAHALGVRNVLALTGDPPSLGDYAHAKAVYDIDSIGLIRVISQLNQGVDTGGNSIGTPTNFLIGCALNPTTDDLEYELDRFARKLDAGAHFVMTQPVYDAELFESVLSRIGPCDVPILMGILPLQNYRHALFIHNELPGVRLTEEALVRMERAGAEGIPEGLALAKEMIDDCGHLVAGIYVMPSFGRYEMAAQLVSDLLVPV